MPCIFHLWWFITLPLFLFNLAIRDDSDDDSDDYIYYFSDDDSDDYFYISDNDNSGFDKRIFSSHLFVVFDLVLCQVNVQLS